VNIISRIQAFNAGRDPDRLKLKYRKMRKNAFAFLRGTCHLYYDRLPDVTIFQSAPLAWVCGDLHIENFGSYKAASGLDYFDINDFDEAVLAPLSWDLLRMLSSLRVGADSLSIRKFDTRNYCKAFLDAYAISLSQGKSYWVERKVARGPIRELLKEQRELKRLRFLNAHTKRVGKKRILRLTSNVTLPVSDAQRAEVTNAITKLAQQQADAKFFDVLAVC
jgi:uncharacterized protein (DUF2252 family)